MWCHLCKRSFIDKEVFSIHIMKKHRLSSTFNEDNSDSEHSNQDEINESEMDESDEIKENNSGEDFFSDDKCSESKSHINAATPRKNTKLKRVGFKLTRRNNVRKKTILKQRSKQPTSKNFVRKQPVSKRVFNSLNEFNIFDFDSENIHVWLQKFKEMYKKSTLPLEPSLVDMIRTIHKEIFCYYCTTQSSRVTSAVLKVYEELNWLMDRHINSIYESL